MVDEIGEDGNHLDKGEDLTMEDKDNNIMNGGTSTTWMFSFLGKKLWKRKKHKGKISPSSSRMMRTISIHHLECIDFVSQSEVGETVTDGESSKIALNSDSLAMGEPESQALKATHESAKGKPGETCRGIYAAVVLPESHAKIDKTENHLLDKHIVLKGKLIEVRDALLKLKDVDLKGMANEFAKRSKLFLDTLELLNANREAILDAREDPNYNSSEYVERLQVPAKARMLTKSASFPGLDFSGSAAGYFLPSYRRVKSVSVVSQGTNSESVSSFINIVGVGSGSEVSPGSHELRKRREAGTVLNRLRNLQERIKDVILENRKEKKRISRDRILHKVPFGHKLLEDVRDKNLNLWDGSSSLERCDRGSEGGNFNVAPRGSYGKFAQNNFQRSCSLNESLDRYSHLLETISLNEKGEVPESSISIRKDNCLLQGKLPKSLGRMLSSPVFRSYSFSMAVQSEASPESSKILVAEPFGRKMDRIVRSKSIQEDNGSQQEKLPKNFVKMLSSPVFRSYSFSKAGQSEPYLESSQIVTSESLGIVMETNVDPDSLFITEEDIRSDKYVSPTVESITEMIETRDYVVESEYIEPFLFTEVVEEESDLVNRHEAKTEAESDIKTENSSFISSLDLNMVEGSANSAKYLLREGSNLRLNDDDDQTATSLPIHVDRKYDHLFKSVRYLLSKSGYDEPLVSPYEFAAEIGTPFDQNLLNDLINEALVEIYELSTAPNLWLLNFHSKIRSMPVGNYLLRDVWTEIRWLLCAPQGLDATLDDLMAHDFARNDGWMNLYREAECVALQMEYLILDDLLDEAVVGGSDGFAF